MSNSVRPHRRPHTRIPRPWDSPAKNTGVGCHFLLQCMQVKSESEVAQSCPTLRNPMDCSLPGSSTHGIFQARILEWGAIESWVNFDCIFLFHGASQVALVVKEPTCQCRKVKSESEVTQSCPILHDPMGSSPPGSSFHGTSHTGAMEWAASAFSSKVG